VIQEKITSFNTNKAGRSSDPQEDHRLAEAGVAKTSQKDHLETFLRILGPSRN